MIGDEPTDITPLQKLRAVPHAKAKDAPSFRFYTLYDKVIVATCCKPPGNNAVPTAAPGVDGQTFADIEQYGVKRWLGELAEELRTKRYEPQPVRRVYLPKPDGSGGLWGSHDPRPRGANRRVAGLGADLRGRLAARAVCVSRNHSAWRRCKKCIACWGKGIAKWWKRT